MAGQPDKYKPEYDQAIIDHMKNGDSLVSFAASVLVSKHSVYRWIEKYPSFRDASEIARTLCEQWWEKQGKDGLWFEQGDRKLSEGVHKFYMKCRFGWRDNDITVSESDDKEGLTINFSKDKKD